MRLKGCLAVAREFEAHVALVLLVANAAVRYHFHFVYVALFNGDYIFVFDLEFDVTVGLADSFVALYVGRFARLIKAFRLRVLVESKYSEREKVSCVLFGHF